MKNIPKRKFFLVLGIIVAVTVGFLFGVVITRTDATDARSFGQWGQFNPPVLTEEGRIEAISLRVGVALYRQSWAVSDGVVLTWSKPHSALGLIGSHTAKQWIVLEPDKIASKLFFGNQNNKLVQLKYQLVGVLSPSTPIVFVTEFNILGVI